MCRKKYYFRKNEISHFFLHFLHLQSYPPNILFTPFPSKWPQFQFEKSYIFTKKKKRDRVKNWKKIEREEKSFEGLKSIAGGPWSYYLHPFALFGWRLTDHPQAFIYFHAVRMPASPAFRCDCKEEGSMAEKEKFFSYCPTFALFVALKMNVDTQPYSLLYACKKKRKGKGKRKKKI